MDAFIWIAAGCIFLMGVWAGHLIRIALYDEEIQNLRWMLRRIEKETREHNHS